MELGSPRAEGNRTSDATTSHIQMPSPWATSPGSAAGPAGEMEACSGAIGHNTDLGCGCRDERSRGGRYLPGSRTPNETAIDSRTGTMPDRLSPAVFLVTVLSTVAAIIMGSSHVFMPVSRAEDHADSYLKSGSKVYHIPWQYLPSTTPFNDIKGYSEFTIAMLLPDFKPAALNRAEFARVGWHNQLTALFEHGRQKISPEKWISIARAEGGAPIERDIEQIANCRAYDTQKWISKDMFVCHGDKLDQPTLVLICKRAIDVPAPSCTVTENIDRDLSVIYHYSRKYVGQAIQIDDHVRRLAQSFTSDSQ